MSFITKTLYFILLIALVLQPHYVAGHIFTFSTEYAQSITTVIILLLIYGVYRLNQADILKKQHEIRKSNDQLQDAWKYIGKTNRRLPLLSRITTNILCLPKENKRNKKRVFEDLLDTAVIEIVGAEYGLFRFVDKRKGRTVSEITNTNYLTGKDLQISNKELLTKVNHEQVFRMENGLTIIASSQSQSEVVCFLVLPNAEDKINDNLAEVQAITDQALLLHGLLSSV